MHQAYEIHSILKQGVHIESIAAYGKFCTGHTNGVAFNRPKCFGKKSKVPSILQNIRKHLFFC